MVEGKVLGWGRAVILHAAVFGSGLLEGAQHGYVLLDGALLEQRCKLFGLVALVWPTANDDAAGVQVVIQRAAFTEEFGAEQDV